MLPRFYVEAAILRCYSFLTVDQYSAVLSRLSAMTRGIGDPLVAAYARCYLCRVGALVSARVQTRYLSQSYEDLLLTFGSQVTGDSVQNSLAAQNVDMARYVALYAPALDWVCKQ